MTIVQQDNTKLHSLGMPHAIFHAFMLSILCAISYWLITYLLARAMSVSRDDNLLGRQVGGGSDHLRVYRNSRDTSFRAAISCLLATSLCFVLCFTSLLVFPYRLVGMVALIGIGAGTKSRINRPDELTTTAITTAVVMVVAALNPSSA